MKEMGVVLGLTLFIVVCIWVLVDSRRLRRWPAKPLRRVDLERGFVPGARSVPSATTFFLALAAVVLTLALSEYLYPSMPPFSGKASTLKTLAVQAFGPRGIAILYCLGAALLAGLGLANWTQRSDGKFKVPGRAGEGP